MGRGLSGGAFMYKIKNRLKKSGVQALVKLSYKIFFNLNPAAYKS